MEAFRAALAELDLSGKIVATDITDTSSAYRKADVGVLVPSAGRIDYVPALLGIIKKHNVSLLVPVTDLDVRSLARQRRKFDERGCTVMLGSESAVMRCSDKAHMNALLGEAGLATIETCTLSAFRARPFYPCFIKPVRGSAGVGTGVIHNEKELRAHVATYGDLMLVQQYVPGREYTMDVYRSRAGEVLSVVPRQRLLVRSGEVEKGVTVKDGALIDATVKLSACLDDIWGVFCCQCRLADSGPPRFFEINPRFGGGVPLSIAAGANFPLYLLQEVLGMEITARLGEFTENLLMLRYDEAVFAPARNVTKLPGYNAPEFR